MIVVILNDRKPGLIELRSWETKLPVPPTQLGSSVSRTLGKDWLPCQPSSKNNHWEISFTTAGQNKKPLEENNFFFFLQHDVKKIEVEYLNPQFIPFWLHDCYENICVHINRRI